MRKTRTELRLECRKRKTQRAKRLPTSPKRKNKEYRTARARRKEAFSNVHGKVWLVATTEEVEMEAGGGEVAEKRDDIEVKSKESDGIEGV